MPCVALGFWLLAQRIAFQNPTATQCRIAFQKPEANCNTSSNCNTMPHRVPEARSQLQHKFQLQHNAASRSMRRPSALQCVAVCCSALQCVAVRCSVLQCVAVRCGVLLCF